MARADLDVETQRIVLTTQWTEKDLAKQVPGFRWDSQQKHWHGPLSWGSCQVLRGVFQDRLEIGDHLRQWATYYKDEFVLPALELREALEVQEFFGEGMTRLYPPQRAGVAFLNTSDGILLGDEMGVGKTPQVLVSLRANVDSLPALVICPNSVKGHWEREASVWFPEANTYVIGGGAGQRRKQLYAAMEDPAALVLINFEAVRLHTRLAPYGSVRLARCREHGGHDERITDTRCEVHPKELNDLDFQTVIIDEAHRMKDPKAKQTRACWAVMHGDTVQKRLALTGTPIANDVGDLWSIMHGVAPLDYPTKTTYIDRYALLSWNRFAALDIVGVRPDTKDEFNRVLHPRMRRMLKAIVLPHLPPKVRETREAQMIPKQAKAYREMETQLFTQLENGDSVLAPTNLTKALRLLQFSSSYCEIDEESNTVKLTEPSPKLDVLEEVLEELGPGRQVAVCAASRQLIDLAAARLEKSGVTHRLLTGTVPQDQRTRNLAEFQAGDAQVMLFTIAAGGVGVNMSAADTIVFLQRSWSMLENKQAEDRVHRVGSERHESITVVDIVAPDTIEVRQLQRLREKQDRLEEIVEDRKRLQEAGLAVDQLDAEELEILSGQVFEDSVR